VAALDSFGREPDGPVQPRPDVLRTWARGRHSLDIRLVVIGHHLVRDHPATLDRLPKEGFGTRRIAVLTQQDINDHAILVDRSVQVLSS